MIRTTVMALLITVGAFLQGSFFEIFEIASIKPNLLLILTVSFALMRGRRAGMLTGFFSGLALDLFFPGTVGFNALVYLWIGYVAGGAYSIFYDDDIKTPLFLVTLADLFYGIVNYVFLFLMRGRIHFFFYLKRIIIPEVLYTIIMTFVLYRILYAINRKLRRSDKRSVDSFV